MENFKLEKEVILEPGVAIAIRKYLGTVPADQIGLPNLVSLDNAISDAVQKQEKEKEIKAKKDA